jgi:hypothetical protein
VESVGRVIKLYGCTFSDGLSSMAVGIRWSTEMPSVNYPKFHRSFKHPTPKKLKPEDATNSRISFRSSRQMRALSQILKR